MKKLLIATTAIALLSFAASICSLVTLAKQRQELEAIRNQKSCYDRIVYELAEFVRSNLKDQVKFDRDPESLSDVLRGVVGPIDGE